MRYVHDDDTEFTNSATILGSKSYIGTTYFLWVVSFKTKYKIVCLRKYFEKTNTYVDVYVLDLQAVLW